VNISDDIGVGPHKLVLSVVPDTSNTPVQIRLSWVTPKERDQTYSNAIAAAKAAKTAVVFVWAQGNPQFHLADAQNKLVEDVAAANPNTIVVLNVSQPVALPWLDKVKAVLQMWWPGDEGGWATANVLLGKVNPAGRLPFTWGRRLEDYPATDPKYPERLGTNADGEGVFSEGIFVGYRWFDQNNIDPLFPFGFGLSYTRFEYSKLTATKAGDDGINVTFTVKNMGATTGDEVPQAYLGAPEPAPSEAQFAPRALAGFDRIHLLPNQSQVVRMHISLRSLQYWSTSSGRWQTVTAPRMLYVGRSSRDLPLSTSIR
jgi:beta-glucosidase